MKKAENITWNKKLPDNSVIFTCPHAEIAIPQDYFDHYIAEVVGKQVDVFGLFEIKIWSTEDIENEIPKAYFFKFKGRIRTVPTQMKEGRSSAGTKQTILSYDEGATFVVSTNLQTDSDVARQMLDIMTMGYLPNVIPYEEIAQYWTDVNIFNGISLDSMSQSAIEMIVSEIVRDPLDLSRPFRHRLRDDPKFSRTAWKIINIHNIPKFTSTFASLTSGDPRSNLVSVISRQRQGKQQRTSPLEDAIL